jgi:hypothetical protein
MRFFHHGDGSRTLIEEEVTVNKVRRFLPAGESRAERLVQLWAIEGGMRTYAVRDIVDVS